jgi:hypothetical protein
MKFILPLSYALGLCLHAQALAEEIFKPITPPAPESGILDESRIFKPESRSFQRISEVIQKLNAARGYQTYLVVEPVIIGESPLELAERLKQAWLTKQDGLVVVFETTGRNLGAGRHLESDETVPKQVPSFVTTDLLNRAVQVVDPTLPTETYLEAFMAELTAGLDTYFTLRDSPPPPERNFKVELVILGTLAVLGLASIAAREVIRNTSMADVQTYQFPEVSQPERLGAPFGAAVTSRPFAPADESHRAKHS